MRNGTELLDRLLKDTVTENSGNEKFDIIVFMQLLRERIYVKNSYVRQFLVSWLKVLDSEPNVNIVYHISDLLDGLFQILDDNNIEIKKMCENLLGDFLKEISSPQVENMRHDVMINIILVHCANSSDDSIQLTAMLWLKELINLLGDNSLSKLPVDIIYTCSFIYISFLINCVFFLFQGILNVVLPCLSYGDDNLKRNVRELARSINTILWGLVEKSASSSPSQNNNQKHEESNGSLVKSNKIEISKLIESLSRLMLTPSDSQTVMTTIESLKWILHIVNKQPDLVDIENLRIQIRIKFEFF